MKNNSNTNNDNNLFCSKQLHNFFNDTWSKLMDPHNHQSNNQQPNATTKQSFNFWTVCPYCFYMHEYENMYENCCLRCDNCHTAFQAVPTAAAAGGQGGPPSLVVDGKEFYCGIGFFPLGYVNVAGGGGGFGGGQSENGKTTKVKQEKKNGGGFGGSGEKKGGGESENVTTEEVMQGMGGGKKLFKKVKSVPRFSKKVAGRGVKIGGSRVKKNNGNVESQSGQSGIWTDCGGGVGVGGGSCSSEGKVEFF